MNDIRGQRITFGIRQPGTPHAILKERLHSSLYSSVEGSLEVDILNRKLQIGLVDTHSSALQLKRTTDGFLCRHKVYLEYEIKMEDN